MTTNKNIKEIPANDCKLFTTAEGRRELMKKYGESDTAYAGRNENGERVIVSIYANELIIETYQSNKWVRKDVYDENGLYSEELYCGRW